MYSIILFVLFSQKSTLATPASTLATPASTLATPARRGCV
jgi:hypothetical protein